MAPVSQHYRQWIGWHCLQWKISRLGTVCASKPHIYMWHLGTWFSGGLGRIRFMTRLNDLKGLFQTKWFYDSMTLYFHIDFQVRHRNKNNHISLLYGNQTLPISIFLRLGTLNLHTHCVRISRASHYFHILLSWKEMYLNSFKHQNTALCLK